MRVERILLVLLLLLLFIIYYCTSHGRIFLIIFTYSIVMYSILFVFIIYINLYSMPAVLSEKSRPWSVMIMNNWKGRGTNAVSTLWNCGNCGLSDYLSFKTEQLNLICINPFLMHRCGLIGELFQQFGKIFYIFIVAIV